MTLCPKNLEQKSRHWRYRILLACLLSALLVTGCASSERKALEPYAKATLTAGTGLGNLELAKTTLGWFADTIGAKTVAVLVADEVAIELVYLKGEASFLFIVSGACQEQTGAPMTRLDINKGIKDFLSSYPACNDLTLSSISVGTGSSETKTFFKGSTNHGVQLWSPIANAYQHGLNQIKPGQFVTGEWATNDLARIEFPEGIYFYYDAGEQPTEREITSAAPLSTKRQLELEQSAEEAAKNAVIKRITIFIPEE
jgi:hypothetical protein